LGYMGAISADGTLSRAKFAHENDANGGSWRLRYSKSMLSTGTSLDLTALRYSTRNFYTFSEYNGTGYEGRDEDSLSGSHHR
ncbi:fimbria/pilus outer membrane usher protein, partial [Staphylococcus aureus]|uniref:fimbria/pilus outer membrane usher protein n=2 Tax=Bacteria TaxID=2 RepID=UPI00403565EB